MTRGPKTAALFCSVDRALQLHTCKDQWLLPIAIVDKFARAINPWSG
jgi:hypothetical protein